MSWSAKQYVTFEDERTRPVRDLLAAIPGPPPCHVIDLGCGPGNSTERLAASYPGAHITGLDSAPDMVAAARRRLPALQFEQADIQSWTAPAPVDLIFANAVLHWLPDHAALLPHLVAQLAPGGSLAVQMPDNLEEPAHRAMRALAAQPRWAPKLAAAAGARTAMHDAGWYYGLLQPHCARVDVWRTTYHHHLPGGVDAVVEWFKGSGLLPFLAPLTEPERAAFLAEYRAAIALDFPLLPGGGVLLPFPRLFIVATRAGAS